MPVSSLSAYHLNLFLWYRTLTILTPGTQVSAATRWTSCTTTSSTPFSSPVTERWSSYFTFTLRIQSCLVGFWHTIMLLISQKNNWYPKRIISYTYFMLRYRIVNKKRSTSFVVKGGILSRTHGAKSFASHCNMFITMHLLFRFASHSNWYLEGFSMHSCTHF